MGSCAWHPRITATVTARAADQPLTAATGSSPPLRSGRAAMRGWNQHWFATLLRRYPRRSWNDYRSDVAAPGALGGLRQAPACECTGEMSGYAAMRTESMARESSDLTRVSPARMMAARAVARFGNLCKLAHSQTRKLVRNVGRARFKRDRSPLIDPASLLGRARHACCTGASLAD